MQNLRNAFEGWTWFEKAWMITFTAVNIYLFFAWEDTILGLITSLTGMACVVLVAKGKTFNFYPGIINVILYAYLSYQQAFYGEVALNILYFLPAQFLGLYLWNRHKKTDRDSSDVLVKTLSNRERVLWTVLSLIFILLIGIILENIGGAQPYIDSTTTILQIIAQIFMIRRLVEQWLVWIAVDVFSITLWLTAFISSGNDVTVLVMWIAYLFNATYGFYNWKKIFYRQRGLAK